MLLISVLLVGCEATGAAGSRSRTAEDSGVRPDTVVPSEDSGSEAPEDTHGETTRPSLCDFYAPPPPVPGPRCVRVVGSAGRYATLQAAVDAAPDGGTVTLCPGAWKGNVHIRRSVTIEGAGSTETTIRAHASAPGVCVDRGTVVTLRALAVEHGWGGVESYADDLALEDVVLDGGRATYGGGLYAQGGTLTLSGVEARGGLARYGGGVYLEGVTASLSDVTFSGNEAEMSGGGAWVSGGSFDAVGLSVMGNTVIDGGGGLALVGTTARLETSALSENEAGGYQDLRGGGGALVAYGARLEMVDTTISENHSPGGGGGLRLVGEVEVLGGEITGNQGGIGGGVEAGSDEPGTSPDAHLVGVRILGNTASYGGGVAAREGTVTLAGCAIERNVAEPGHRGGGLYVREASVELAGGTVLANHGNGASDGAWVQGILRSADTDWGASGADDDNAGVDVYLVVEGDDLPFELDGRSTVTCDSTARTCE